MRSIWTGVISFGMVTIPVKLYTAVEEKSVKFKLLHRKDGSPIEERRFCIEEGVEVEWDDLVRGYPVGKDDFVVLEPEEIEAAEPESARSIEIGDFVELEEIDPIYYQKTYFLEPQEAGAKAFNLLRRALEETGRVAVAKVSIRNRERLATVRVYDSTLVLETMLWPDEIRDAAGLAPDTDVEIRPQELSMAASYIDTLTGEFEPDEFTDEYAGALRELVEAKVAGREVTQVPEPAGRGADVIDLMAALEASVAEAKKSRGAPEKKAAPAKKEPAKKAAKAPAAAKKAAPAKRTAAKKTAAKKAAPRKKKTA